MYKTSPNLTLNGSRSHHNSNLVIHNIVFYDGPTFIGVKSEAILYWISDSLLQAHIHPLGCDESSQ